jgi:hypothetical protein
MRGWLAAGDAAIAGESQLARLTRLVVAPATLFKMAFAGGWIDNSHVHKVFSNGQQNQMVDTSARPSEYLRACHPAAKYSATANKTR